MATRAAARVVVLGAWTAFFVWLYLSGEMTRYLGPRTYWVVPLGAVILAGATLAQVAALRGERSRAELSLGEALRLAVLLVPIAAVAVVPSAALGALAASRKTAGAGAAAVGAIAPPAVEGDGDISFVEIFYASQSEAYAAEAGITSGTPVELTGFVTRDASLPEATFGLTRFAVSCCAADALPYTVPVAGRPDGQKDDSWLRVEGRLVSIEGQYVLEPASIEPVAEPEEPYLY